LKLKFISTLGKVRHEYYKLLCAFREECSLESFSLETRRQTGLLRRGHISFHPNGIISIGITLLHDFIYATDNFQYSPRVPWQNVDGILQFDPFQFFVLVRVKVFSRTTNDVRTAVLN
jgi:hypothetical protein